MVAQAKRSGGRLVSLREGFFADFAILSADIQGSSDLHLSEADRTKLMESLIGFVNRQLEAIAVCIVRKVEGDGVLLITGNVELLPKIASRLRGALLLETYASGLTDVNLRLGASFGRLKVVRGVGGEADAGGDAITRAKRIQAANSDGHSLWCDESVVQALIKIRAPVALQYEGEKEVRGCKDAAIWSLSEEQPDSGFYRKLTCFNQGLSIQQWCMASWLHRGLKGTLVAATSGDEDARAALEEEREALQNYLRRSLQTAALGTFAALQDYFARRVVMRSTQAPRICLKGFEDIFETQGARIVDLVREQSHRMGPAVFQCENTGFDHVVKTGTPFLCNDLASMDSYLNPRFVPKKIEALRTRLADGSCQAVDSGSWPDCWKDGKKNPGSCYRSTLIIPLTLKNNKGLDSIFVKRFGGGRHDERLIYGALCFDHVEPHFFRDDDIDIGYVAADWLSLYLLTQINYTNRSTSYAAAGEEVLRYRKAKSDSF
jgi:hypothetical protein